MKNSLTDGRLDRRTDDRHRVMGKALADIVSLANKNLNTQIAGSPSYGIVAIIEREEIQAKYRNRLHR